MNFSRWRVLSVLEREEPVPYCWRDGIQSWIYSVLKETTIGKDIHCARYSLFVFHLEPEIFSFEANVLKSKSRRWYFRFASAIPEASALVLSALIGTDEVDFGFGVFRVLETYKDPLTSQVEFRATPILAAKMKERGFWTPNDPEFGSAVKRSLENRWRFFTGAEFPDVEVRVLGMPRQKLIQYKNRNFLSFSCDVRIKAPLEVRQFAQCVGLGQKPSCGFGYLI